MGRNRKLQRGEIARYVEDGATYYGIVADYRINHWKNGEYRLIDSDEWGRRRGQLRWKWSFQLEPVMADSRYTGYKVRRARRWYAVWVGNKRLGERGCECQCCIHRNEEHGQD